MKLLDFLSESFDEWDKEFWIHYSKEDLVKIKYDTNHRDPVGIYLFPKDFEPNDFWKKFKNKFMIYLKDNIKVLDLSKITIEMAEKIVSENFPELFEELEKRLYSPYYKPGEALYKLLRDHFNPKRQNIIYRNLGYDAIFDDIKAIHNFEIQLILLTPGLISKIEKINKKSNLIESISKIFKEIKKIAFSIGADIEFYELKKDKYRGVSLDIKIIKDKKYIFFTIYPNVKDYGRIDINEFPTKMLMDVKFTSDMGGTRTYGLSNLEFDLEKQSFTKSDIENFQKRLEYFFTE